MKPSLISEESFTLSRMERLLKLQNAAVQLELLVRKMRESDIRQYFAASATQRLQPTKLPKA